MTKLAVLSLSTSLIFSTVASAQDTRNKCDGVLRIATVINASMVDYAQGQKVYETTCKGSSVKSSFNYAAEGEAIIKSIPAAFNTSIGDTKSKIKSFCRDYRNNKASFLKTLNIRSRPADAAIKAWDRCNESPLRYSITGLRELFSASIKRGYNDADITNVSIAGNLSCVGDGGQIFENNTLEKSIPLSTKAYSISCSRQPDTTDPSKYGYGEVVIATNQGNVSFVTPEISVTPPKIVPEERTCTQVAEIATKAKKEIITGIPIFQRKSEIKLFDKPQMIDLIYFVGDDDIGSGSKGWVENFSLVADEDTNNKIKAQSKRLGMVGQDSKNRLHFPDRPGYMFSKPISSYGNKLVIKTINGEQKRIRELTVVYRPITTKRIGIACN